MSQPLEHDKALLMWNKWQTKVFVDGGLSVLTICLDKTKLSCRRTAKKKKWQRKIQLLEINKCTDLTMLWCFYGITFFCWRVRGGTLLWSRSLIWEKAVSLCSNGWHTFNHKINKWSVSKTICLNFYFPASCLQAQDLTASTLSPPQTVWVHFADRS